MPLPLSWKDRLPGNWSFGRNCMQLDGSKFEDYRVVPTAPDTELVGDNGLFLAVLMLPELIALIFEHAYVAAEGGAPSKHADTSSAALRAFSGVCKLWSKVAPEVYLARHYEPAAWLGFTTLPSPAPSHRLRLPLRELWPRLRMVNLSLKSGWGVRGDDLDSCHDCLADFLSALHLLKRLTLTLSGSIWPSSRFFDNFQNRPGLVRSLDVDVTLEQLPTVNRLLTHCERLESVRLAFCKDFDSDSVVSRIGSLFLNDLEILLVADHTDPAVLPSLPVPFFSSILVPCSPRLDSLTLTYIGSPGASWVPLVEEHGRRLDSCNRCLSTLFPQLATQNLSVGVNAPALMGPAALRPRLSRLDHLRLNVEGLDSTAPLVGFWDALGVKDHLRKLTVNGVFMAMYFAMFACKRVLDECSTLEVLATEWEALPAAGVGRLKAMCASKQVELEQSDWVVGDGYARVWSRDNGRRI